MTLSGLTKTLGLGFVALALCWTTKAQSNDIRCSEGLQVGFVHNSYTYNAPFEQFANVTKSFFDIKWYDDTIINSTTGTNNVPGATRSGPWGQGILNETLLAYHYLPDSTMEYTYNGSGTGWFPPLNIASYVETIRIESVCSGRATYIDLLTYLCSNEQALTYTLWYELHTATFDQVATNLGATVMAGDCSGA